MGTPQISSPLRALNEVLEGEQTTYLGKAVSTYDAAHLNPIKGDRPPVVVYERVETPKVPDSDIESIETLSASSSTKDDREFPEQYRIRGLKWGTPRFVNTCNMDNFLSCWVRRVRQTHYRCAKLVVTRDRPGLALLDIAYHVHSARNSMNSSIIKRLWLEAILPSSGEQDLMGQGALDCIGDSLCSIFQHLRNHSSYSVESSCPCGTFYYRDYFFEIGYDLDQLNYLSNEDEYHKLRSPKCSRCGHKRLVKRIKQDPDNWLMPVAYYGSIRKKNRSPQISRIPKFLRVGGIDFKLASVSYSQNVDGNPLEQHEVSLQLIRGQWYLYDGYTPMFNKWVEPNYETEEARLITLVYLKQVSLQGEE